MFRVSEPALTSQRKRGIVPGSLAVKVGGRYLYPRALIDRYLETLASEAQDALGLDDAFAAELFRSPPTSRRLMSLAEAADHLGIDSSTLERQFDADVIPGSLGWRPTPQADIVFTPRDLDIWTEANANQNRQDPASRHAD